MRFEKDGARMGQMLLAGQVSMLRTENWLPTCQTERSWQHHQQPWWEVRVKESLG